MSDNKFSGVWTALVTPFKSDGSIDWEAFDKLVKTQVEAKVTGVVLSGTTGEAPTLSVQEKLSIIRKVKASYSNDLLIMAGTGGNNTAQSVELSKLGADSGADILLITTPPYNKPSLEGLKAHFNAIAEAQDKPICMYHVPGRTAHLLTSGEISEICDIEKVTMVKEASGNLALFSRSLNSSMAEFFSGDDPTFLASLAVGGNGVISVFSNVFPKEVVALYNAFKNGNTELALEYHNALLAFNESLYVETNPCPVKACLSHMGMIENNFRLPLVPVSDENFSLISKIYEETKEALSRIG